MTTGAQQFALRQFFVEKADSHHTKKEYIVGDRNNRVCPVERAGSLDNRIRRWLQDPQKILRPYIEEGMTYEHKCQLDRLLPTDRTT